MWGDENPRISQWVVPAVGSIVKVNFSHFELMMRMFNVRGFIHFVNNYCNLYHETCDFYSQSDDGAKMTA
jgi:hypothetical protein